MSITIIPGEIASASDTVTEANQVAIRNTAVPNVPNVNNVEDLVNFLQTLVERINNQDRTSQIITDQDRRFLNEIMEMDIPDLIPLRDREDVTRVDLYVSEEFLIERPLDNPAADTSGNPPYFGGIAAKLGNADFALNTNRLNYFLYLRITGNLPANEFEHVQIQHRDIDGTLIQTLSFSENFIAIPQFTSGNERTYAYGITSDSFTQIRYLARQTFTVVFDRVNEQFSFSDNVILPAVTDISLSQLNQTVQALITANHNISEEQRIKLAGLQVMTTRQDVPEDFVFLAKFNEASADNDITHYNNVQQATGIFPFFSGAGRALYFVLVDQSIELVQGAEFRQVLNNNNTLAGQFEGVVLNRNAYTVRLPAADNPGDNTWQLNGMQIVYELTGADDSFKINFNNLNERLQNDIQSVESATPSGQLPEILQRIEEDVTSTTVTTTLWRRTGRFPGINILAAALWFENRRTFGNGNLLPDSILQETFETGDVGDLTVTYTTNDYYFYESSLVTAQVNSQFRGAQSFVFGGSVNLTNANAALNRPLTQSRNKLVYFEFRINSPVLIPSAMPVTMAAHGNGGVLFWDGFNGLHLEQGNGDGGTAERITRMTFPVTGGHWAVHSGTTPEAFTAVIEVPMNFGTGINVVNLRMFIRFDLDANGNTVGNHIGTYIVMNLNNSVDFDEEMITIGDFTITVRVSYNVVQPAGNRRFFIRQVGALTNSALTYNISAYADLVQTYPVSETFTRLRLDPNPNQYRVYDPDNADTTFRGRVLYQIVDVDPNDASVLNDGSIDTNREMGIKIVYNDVIQTRGARVNTDNIINLHRRNNYYNHSNITFGGSGVSVTRTLIMDVAQVEGQPVNTNISTLDMHTLYQNAPGFLGLLQPPGQTTDIFEVNASIEITQNMGETNFLIVPDDKTGERKVIVVDGETVTARDAE